MTILRFEVYLLEDADNFLSEIEPKAKKKLVIQMHRATTHIDPKIFKKLDEVLWEFRVESNRLQYRLLAFWDRRDGKLALVVATHGFIKKTDKIPGNEMKRAYDIRTRYYKDKNG